MACTFPGSGSSNDLRNIIRRQNADGAWFRHVARRRLICFTYLYSSQLKLTQSDAGAVIAMRRWSAWFGGRYRISEGLEGFCQSQLQDMVT